MTNKTANIRLLTRLSFHAFQPVLDTRDPTYTATFNELKGIGLWLVQKHMPILPLRINLLRATGHSRIFELCH
ncbi:hypothetical protein D3C75_1182150 [compost metagenome]